MHSRAREAIAPAYLLLCLLFGGSAQGAWQNALLQLVGIAMLAWAALSRSGRPIASGAARNLLLLAIAAIAVVALQEVPLPISFWRVDLRARIVHDLAILGFGETWLPISLTPYESLTALLMLIPPLAMFVAIVRLGAYRPAWLVVSLFGGTLAGVLLGAVQVATARQSSFWYPYPETNLGLAVGFFANANHMAILLVATLPFVFVAATAVAHAESQRRSAVFALLAVFALVLLLGIGLNGSLAGYSLVVPVLCLSAAIALRRSRRWRRITGAVAVVSAVAALALLATSSVTPATTKIAQSSNTALQSRELILKTTLRAIGSTMPFGTGLGSFKRVYPMFESREHVTSEYVIHAHNDYAELALELGVAGIVLMLAFLVWWGQAAWRKWRPGGSEQFARAASIASAAVLIHSLVDFPLRTAAISALFAMCLGLLADRRTLPRERAELRPPRHLVFK